MSNKETNSKTNKAKVSKTESQSKKLNYPSLFGSHASMVDQELTNELNDENKVVCRDDHGTYVTEKKNLDNGMADVNRNAGHRFEYLCKGKEE
jgi:hypothetical protein